MARVTFSTRNNYVNNNSPGGFWTPPGGKHTRQKQHSTWEVPLRRKTRKKMYKNIKFYVDIQKDDIGYIKSGEITTDNRFAALADHNIETRKPQERSGRSCPDYDHSEERKPFIFDDLSNFISIIDDLSSKDYKMNNYIMFVNNNKNSLSTGYYPDIIYLESDNFSNTNGFNHKNNPFMYNGKPIRQVSNSHSRYNNEYYLKMKSTYSISQHIFNGPSPSSSRGTRATSVGTKGEWNTVAKRKYVRKFDKTRNTNSNANTNKFHKINNNSYRVGNHGVVDQLHQIQSRNKHGQQDQYPGGNQPYTKEGENWGSNTPFRHKVEVPRINLYKNLKEYQETKDNEINEKIPQGTDLEILLVNSCKIDAIKVQTIIDEFLIDNKHITIFCLTETKVNGHDFKPVGIEIFSKHRGWKEKKGGGLALGYATSSNLKFEELITDSNDILAVEGKIKGTKCRIILCYFDCTKKLKGKDYNRNREVQKKVEKLMEVDLGTALLVLGDFNGRLTKIEPNIKTDANGHMLETWVDKSDLFHLNTMNTCTGKYTFTSLNGKSAIDHMLTNKLLYEKHISM